MLFYPLVNKKLNTNSMKEYTDTPMWNSKLTKKMWKYYLKDNNYTAPNESKDLDKMPPIYMKLPSTILFMMKMFCLLKN